MQRAQTKHGGSSALACRGTNLEGHGNDDTSSGDESGGRRAIHLEYFVYIRSASDLIQSADLAKGNTQEKWEKTKHSGDIVWKTDITKWAWEDFKKKIIEKLHHIRQNYFGSHLESQDKAKLLTWKCILHAHRTYGVRANYTVTNDDEFLPFVKEAVNSPANKVIIRLTMEDPVAQAKKIKQVSERAAC